VLDFGPWQGQVSSISEEILVDPDKFKCTLDVVNYKIRHSTHELHRNSVAKNVKETKMIHSLKN